MNVIRTRSGVLRPLAVLCALLTVVTAVAVGGAGGSALASSTALPPAGTQYAALGESGAAGPLIPEPVAPLACFKSDHNYPHDLAAALKLNLDDISCSGAVTADAYQPQKKAGVPINAPQLSAVTKNTKLVTFDFGSNNIMTTQLFTRCLDVETSCKQFFTKGGDDVFADRIAANRNKIGALLSAIRSKAAPGAKILVVSRPQKIRNGGCPAQVPIRAADATYINSVFVRLNAMLEDEASLHGAEYIDTYTPSIGHDICAKKGAEWTEGYVPKTLDFPFHTNKVGHQMIAREIQNALAAGA